jgi:hypothetical protein
MILGDIREVVNEELRRLTRNVKTTDVKYLPPSDYFGKNIMSVINNSLKGQG